MSNCENGEYGPNDNIVLYMESLQDEIEHLKDHIDKLNKANDRLSIELSKALGIYHDESNVVEQTKCGVKVKSYNKNLIKKSLGHE